MSGGSYDYICYKLESACKGQMYDIELNDLISDLYEVLHDLEWWQSGDISELSYRETVANFKQKWFNGNRKERLKKYIDDTLDNTKQELYNLIGE